MILVVGDAMIDRYWFGTVTRVSPEAPVPVLAHERVEDRLGGAANVASNVRALGSDVLTVFSPSYEMTPVVKLRLIARTQQIARVDFDHPQEPVNLGEVERAVVGCRVVILSDYAKGALAQCAEVIAICKAAGATVLVDPKGNNVARYYGADVVKPNHYEMQDMVGAWRDEDDLERRANDLKAFNNIGAIVMTRGERGMTLFENSHAEHCEGRRLDLSDVSGAGDTAIAALAVAIERGDDLYKAMRFANAAAGCAVSRFGTTVVNARDVTG